MVRLAQPWNMRYPLIDGQGNFGNIDGDGAAAMRYTEARLTKIAAEMLRDLKKDVVDFKLNFSEDETEPTVLPARIPNLLLNGTTGIGVAMACSFAPHNIVEVMGAIKAQIKNPKITTKELMQYIKAPDFPTGGIITNQRDLENAYETGKGSVRIRSKYRVEKMNKKDVVVFYEIPFGVTKEKLVTAIVNLVNEKDPAKRIEGISDVRDTSNKNGISIEVELKKGVSPDVIANTLFNKTRLETTFAINQVCIVNREPKLLSLSGLIEQYIIHQKDVIIRRTQFDLAKMLDRAHLIEGLLVALANIDEIIKIIKTSANPGLAIEELKVKFKLSEAQAKGILEMKLRKLTGLEKIELEKEAEELKSKINELQLILSCSSKLEEVLINEIDEITNIYKDNRMTEVTNVIVNSDEKDIQFVQPEDVVVVMTQAGNIKKISAKSFKVQNRNGKGVKNQDDIIMDVIKTNTIDNLMMFTALGKMYKLVVDQVPTGTNTSRGVSAHTLVKLENHDRVIAITSMKRETQAEYVVSISEKGMVKKTRIGEYTSAKKSGIAAVGLREDDHIASITFLNNEDQLLLITQKGMSIRFSTSNIAPIGRTAIGVRGMKVAEDDKVVAAMTVRKGTDDVAIITELGLGKRTPLEAYPVQGKDGKGTITYKPNESTGAIVSAALVEDKDTLLVMGDQTSICISASDLPVLGKASRGNIVLKENRVVSMTKI